jgi:hypothetical protein
MSQTAVATEVHQTLDVHCYFTAQITLDSNLCNLRTYPFDFRFRQVTNPGFRRDTGHSANL